MAARKLASFVYLTDAEHGTVGFGPDDDVPAWASKLIDNPKAWGEEPKVERK